MKVMFFISNFEPYGAQRIVFNIIKNTIDKIEAVVIAFYDTGVLKDEFKKICTTFSLNATKIYDVVAIKRFLDFVNSIKPDIIYSFFPEMGSIAMFAKGVKAYSINNPVTKEALNQKLWHFFAIAKTPNISALSESCLKSVPELFIKNKNTKVLYPVVELKKSDLTKEEAKKELGITGFAFGCIARLTYQKGIDILLRAFSKLNIDSRLVIAGGGDVNKYKKIAVKLGIETKVIFRGEVTDTSKIYKAVDAVIVSSRWEGFPSVPVEAMYNKVCVVAPVYLKEIFGEYIITYKNLEELPEKMKEVFYDTELRKKMEVEGEKYVTQNFNEKKLSDAYIKWLKSI